MKILFDTANREGLICICLYDWLEQAMSKIADCKFWGPGRLDYMNESLEDTIERLYGDDSPDWVITTAYMEEEQGRWMGFTAPPQKERSWKIATFTSDIHRCHVLRTGVEGYVEALNQANFDAILMLYSQVPWCKWPLSEIDPRYYLKNLSASTFHCPSWIDPSLYPPSDEPSLYDASFLGAFEPMQHPIRTDIWESLPDLSDKRKWKTFMATPPSVGGELRINALRKQGYTVGDAYAHVLARSRAFIFGTSIYRYPLLKFVEGWASRTCVIADEPLTSERMGLRDGENYVKITLKNWKKKLRITLNDEEKRRQIADEGYETVMKYHTADVRAKELLTWMKIRSS